MYQEPVPKIDFNLITSAPPAYSDFIQSPLLNPEPTSKFSLIVFIILIDYLIKKLGNICIHFDQV